MSTYERGIDLEIVDIRANNGDVSKVFLNGVDITDAVLNPLHIDPLDGRKLTEVTMTFLVNSISMRSERP